VPDQIIYGVAYNTMTFGYMPLEMPGPYVSLNLGLAEVRRLLAPIRVRRAQVRRTPRIYTRKRRRNTGRESSGDGLPKRHRLDA